MKNKNRTSRGGAFSLVETLIVLAFIALLAAVTMPKARAVLSSQVDTNSLGVFATNTYALYGDITGAYTNYTTSKTTTPNNFIDCSRSTHANFEVGAYFTNSYGAAAGPATNVVFQIFQSDDLLTWQFCTNVLVAVPPVSTNWQFTQFEPNPTFRLHPYYALRSVGITNANGVGIPNIVLGVTTNSSTIFFRCWSRTGI